MSGHYYDDWESREERATRIARLDADNLQHDQQEKERLRRFINEKMEELESDDLAMLYHIAYEVEDYKAFFRVIKSLK